MNYKEEEERSENQRQLFNNNIKKEENIEILDEIRDLIICFNELFYDDSIEENQIFPYISSLNEILENNPISDEIISCFNELFITNLTDSFTLSKNESLKKQIFDLISILIHLKSMKFNEIFINSEIIRIISFLFSSDIIDFNACSSLLSSLSSTHLKARNESMKIIPILSLSSVIEGDNEDEIYNAFDLLISYASHQVSYDMALDIFSIIRTSIECNTLTTKQILLIIESISKNQMKTIDLLKCESLDNILYDNLNNPLDDCCEIVFNIFNNTIKNEDLLMDDIQKIFSCFSESSPPCFVDLIVNIITKACDNIENIQILIEIGSLNILSTCLSVSSFQTKNNIIKCLSFLIGKIIAENPDLMDGLICDNILSAFEPGLESLDSEIQVLTMISLEKMLNYATKKDQLFYDSFIKSLYDLDIISKIEVIETEDKLLSDLCNQFLNRFSNDQ